MGKPAAKEGDSIMPLGVHAHMVKVPGSAPVLAPHPCTWKLTEKLSPNVNIQGKPAATVGSGGDNAKAGNPHKPAGAGFLKPPPNMDKASITRGSSTVKINGKAAARHGDVCSTCNEPVGPASGQVNVKNCPVQIGG
jgi:uncharacterized Zn-binding protein involved in type VI secretion